MDNAGFTSSLLGLLLMVGALACLPWLLNRWQQRQQAAAHHTSGVSAQVLASVAVGPTQRVVTVEVGQGGQKACLVLGVTAQSIQCLHVLNPAAPAPAAVESFATAMVQAQEVARPAQS